MGAEKDQIPADKDAEDRFNKTLERMLGTPHKPHKPAGGPTNDKGATRKGRAR